MIDRRHEKLTLDALEDLVDYLRGVREERKAVLAITDGWRAVPAARDSSRAGHAARVSACRRSASIRAPAG